MGKSTPKTNKTPSSDQIDQYLAGIAAKRSFMSASLNMGWQLALTVLLPVFLGVKLDDHFRSNPSYTLAALVLAIGGAVLVVAQNVKQVNAKNTQQVKIKNTKQVNAKKVSAKSTKQISTKQINKSQVAPPTLSPLTSPTTSAMSSSSASVSAAPSTQAPTKAQLLIKKVSVKKRPV